MNILVTTPALSHGSVQETFKIPIDSAKTAVIENVDVIVNTSIEPFFNKLQSKPLFINVGRGPAL